MIKESKKFKVRLFKVSKELNVAIDTLVDHLKDKGYASAMNGTGPNTTINDEEAYDELMAAFAADMATASRVKEKRAAFRAESDEEEEEGVAFVAPEKTLSSGKEVEEAHEPVAPEPQASVEVVDQESDAVQVEEVESHTDLPEEAEPVEARDDVLAATPDVEALAPVQAEADLVPDHASEQDTDDSAVVQGQDTLEEAALPAAFEEPDEAVESASDAEAPEEQATEPEGEREDEIVDEAAEEAEPAEEVGAALDEVEESLITADRYKLAGTKIIGKIDLKVVEDQSAKKKRKRKRKHKAKSPEEGAPQTQEESVAPKRDDAAKRKKKRKRGPAVDEADVEQTLQDTLRELEQGASRLRQRRRRQRRDERAAERKREMDHEAEDESVLRITEFVSTGELANLMGVPVTEVISVLFRSGMMVSINQRLDADTISFVADEFDFEVEFITEFGLDDIELEEDRPEDLRPRAPVVTVMGHVDHGKTSLLDFIRRTNVVAGEAGGITQHIGAYNVELANGREITFLDTPGHEAFTAMRARGAQVTDVVILVVAADDAVMPQTIEAINHAKAAEVPLVVAINKVDKPSANPQRVMQQLSEHNVLVEQYGGKVQGAMVSAKTGEGVSDLLDKVLLEADLMELKGNPNRNASGVVIESRLEKGRGNVATVLVENGTLRVGDPFVVGIYSGRVRAMFDERENRIDEVGPAKPALVVGLDGSPEVGDAFIAMDEEREAREIAQKRQQIHREQTLRQRKHITLDEIGRRLALGEFRELNLIIKADVGGSVEALADALLKLSTEEVAVNIIHSGVGAITESDVMLASASDAVIIGFQVRPIAGARTLAEREEIDIRTYSIIYNAIEEVRDALEGLLTPEESEKVIGVVAVREIFRVPKIGTIAGCYVVEGRIHRNDRIRLVRDGVVIYSGSISSLKRFKDDVREVQSGYECGLSITNYNDVKVGDQIESYEIVETKRKLEVLKPESR